VYGGYVRLKAADGTTPLALGVPGDTSAGSAAYINSQGFRLTNTYPLGLPIMTSTERDALTPYTGMMILNSTTGYLEIYNGSWKYIALT
jgi:hypothetical protein